MPAASIASPVAFWAAPFELMTSSVRADLHAGQRVGAREVDGHRAGVPAVRAELARDDLALDRRERSCRASRSPCRCPCCRPRRTPHRGCRGRRTAVSVATVWSGVVVDASTPEPLSSSFASKCTLTSELFHSSAFGAGVSGVRHRRRDVVVLQGGAVGGLRVAGLVDGVVADRRVAGAVERDADRLRRARGDLLRAAVDRVADLLDPGEPRLVGRRQDDVGGRAGAPAVGLRALVVRGGLRRQAVDVDAADGLARRGVARRGPRPARS